MDAGGTITVGNMTLTVKPDAYFAGLAAVQRLVEAGRLEGPAVPYATNVLAIMDSTCSGAKKSAGEIVPALTRANASMAS
jgi:hypothetical protein